MEFDPLKVGSVNLKHILNIFKIYFSATIVEKRTKHEVTRFTPNLKNVTIFKDKNDVV